MQRMEAYGICMYHLRGVVSCVSSRMVWRLGGETMVVSKQTEYTSRSPEERRAFITAPIQNDVRVHQPHVWGGMYIRDTVPEAGHRVWAAQPDDEEWCRMKWEEE